MLRAVRLATQFDLTIEPTTAAAIRELAEQITLISAERIAEEIRRLLVHPRRTRGLELLRDLNLLKPIFPELADMPHFVLPDREAPATTNAASEAKVQQPETVSANRLSTTNSPADTALAQEKSSQSRFTLWHHTLQVLDYLTGPTFPLALAALFHDAGKMYVTVQPLTAASASQLPVALPLSRGPFPGHESVSAKLVEQAGRRLRLSNAEWHRAAWLVAHHHALDVPWNLPWHQLKPMLAHPAIDELLVLMEADARANSRGLEHVQFCRDKLREWPAEVLNPPPLITGEDLLEMGLQPGPIFGKILQSVRDAQLDGAVPTREEALHLARQLARQYSGLE
ncbi:CCA-adding enzyme [bacterium HR36]|nr:CCA-adding enzyme [bacterium HR36]